MTRYRLTLLALLLAALVAPATGRGQDQQPNDDQVPEITTLEVFLPTGGRLVIHPRQ